MQYEITGTGLDAEQEPQTSVSGQEQLQVPEEEQTGFIQKKEEQTGMKLISVRNT